MASPWNDLLPVRVEVGGAEYEIESDYRSVLDICAAISDPELDGQDKSFVSLYIFYPDLEAMPPEHYEEALQKCMWFINGGTDEQPVKSPRLVDWEQDFPYIIAPINRVTGKEIRALEYMHWWTFLAAYREIGDCAFAQIVRVRDFLARGKRLDKQDQEWYRRNRHLVDFKRKYTEAEDAEAKKWGF